MNDLKSLNLQPTLVGEQITLRPLQPDDFAQLYHAASDPVIWEQHPHHDRYQREVFQIFFDAAVSSRGALLVMDRASGEVIGTSRYYDWNPSSREIAIGYTFLVRSRWGGSANCEMKQLMLDHIFKWAGKVWFHIGTDNLRSRKAVEKLGGIYSHTAEFPIAGTPHAFFSILADDWRSNLTTRLMP